MDQIQVLARLERWGAVDLTELVSSWRFTTRAGIGFDTAEITVEGPEPGLWVLYDHGAEDALEFWGGGELAWRGLLSGGGLQGQGALAVGMQLHAEGAGLRLRDAEVWRVFADPDYGRWDPDDNLDEGWSADNNNRVYVAASGTFITGDESAVRYPDDETELGADIVEVDALALLTIDSGSWIAEIRDDAGNVLWSATTDTDPDGETVSEAVADAAGLVVALRATADGAAKAEFRLTQVAVRTVTPCTSSDVVAGLLADTDFTCHVDASGVVVDRAAWQGQSYLEALAEMAALGDGEDAWLFAVYDPAASFGAWEDDALWRLERVDLPQWRVEWRRDAVINAVRAQLPDGWRSDWLTDDDSIGRWGRRELTLALPMTTQAEAERLALVFLQERAWPLAALQLDARTRCRKADRSQTWPVWMIRAGDVVVLHDLLPDENRLVQVAETEMTAGGMRITPRGVDSRLEVILAGMERRR